MKTLKRTSTKRVQHPLARDQSRVRTSKITLFEMDIYFSQHNTL